MANPITFKPKPVDPKLELQRRLEAAPNQHAEALLVAYDVLEEAHRQGILDTLHGALRAKDTIFGLLAKYSAEPVSVNAIRNLVAMGSLMGAIDPELLTGLSKRVGEVMAEQKREGPPSLWQILKQTRTPEARRGLGLMTRMLGALGGAAGKS